MLSVREFRELHELVDRIYEEADAMGWDWEKLAKRAGLSYGTVYRLGNCDTIFPRAQTILMLCRAVGLKITVEKVRARIYKAKAS